MINHMTIDSPDSPWNEEDEYEEEDEYRDENEWIQEFYERND